MDKLAEHETAWHETDRYKINGHANARQVSSVYGLYLVDFGLSLLSAHL